MVRKQHLHRVEIQEIVRCFNIRENCKLSVEINKFLYGQCCFTRSMIYSKTRSALSFTNLLALLIFKEGTILEQVDFRDTTK